MSVRFVEAANAPAVRDAFGREGCRLFALEGAGIADKHALLSALGTALGFPTYYGANWDAAEECLRDLMERHPEGIVLLVGQASALWRRLPGELGMLVSIWLGARAAGKPGCLVFLLEDGV